MSLFSPSKQNFFTQPTRLLFRKPSQNISPLEKFESHPETTTSPDQKTPETPTTPAEISQEISNIEKSLTYDQLPAETAAALKKTLTEKENALKAQTGSYEQTAFQNLALLDNPTVNTTQPLQETNEIQRNLAGKYLVDINLQPLVFDPNTPDTRIGDLPKKVRVNYKKPNGNLNFDAQNQNLAIQGLPQYNSSKKPKTYQVTRESSGESFKIYFVPNVPGDITNGGHFAREGEPKEDTVILQHDDWIEEIAQEKSASTPEPTLTATPKTDPDVPETTTETVPSPLEAQTQSYIHNLLSIRQSKPKLFQKEIGMIRLEVSINFQNYQKITAQIQEQQVTSIEQLPNFTKIPNFAKQNYYIVKAIDSQTQILEALTTPAIPDLQTLELDAATDRQHLTESITELDEITPKKSIVSQLLAKLGKFVAKTRSVPPNQVQTTAQERAEIPETYNILQKILQPVEKAKITAKAPAETAPTTTDLKDLLTKTTTVEKIIPADIEEVFESAHQAVETAWKQVEQYFVFEDSNSTSLNNQPQTTTQTSL